MALSDIPGYFDFTNRTRPSRIWHADDPNLSGDQVTFRFNGETLDVDFVAGGDGAIHEGSVPLDNAKVEKLYRALGEWLKYRGVLPDPKPQQHEFCPLDGLDLSRDICQATLKCPKGHGWVLRNQVLLPVGEV